MQRGYTHKPHHFWGSNPFPFIMFQQASLCNAWNSSNRDGKALDALTPSQRLVMTDITNPVHRLHKRTLANKNVLHKHPHSLRLDVSMESIKILFGEYIRIHQWVCAPTLPPPRNPSASPLLTLTKVFTSQNVPLHVPSSNMEQNTKPPRLPLRVSVHEAPATSLCKANCMVSLPLQTTQGQYKPSHPTSPTKLSSQTSPSSFLWISARTLPFVA